MAEDTDGSLGRSFLHYVYSALLVLLAGYGAFTLGFQVRDNINKVISVLACPIPRKSPQTLQVQIRDTVPSLCYAAYQFIFVRFAVQAGQ